MARMRIAQVAPLHESCPPRLYGGTERIVSYLTEALVGLGHDVTLFASGDSLTAARLVFPCERALRLNPNCREPLIYHMIMLNRLMQMADDFDVIHLHTDFLHFGLFGLDRSAAGRAVTTLHGRLDLPDLPAIFQEFPQMGLISISDAQRAPLPWVNWRATVHHGLPTDLYCVGNGNGGYLVFLGRISPEKGPEKAIEIALRAELQLKIAAKVDRADDSYFREVVEPLLAHPSIEFVGELNDGQKADLLADALALLFPIDWPEPFGLAMIEAMAAGTPVIAFRRGSVEEVVEEGVTGAIVDNVEQAVSAIERVASLERAAVRARFEQRFSVERMARDYLRVYGQMREGAARTDENLGLSLASSEGSSRGPSPGAYKQ
jgi:glycosyltransferase involved in cell wall biosynthesis